MIYPLDMLIDRIEARWKGCVVVGFEKPFDRIRSFAEVEELSGLLRVEDVDLYNEPLSNYSRGHPRSSNSTHQVHSQRETVIRTACLFRLPFIHQPITPSQYQ